MLTRQDKMDLVQKLTEVRETANSMDTSDRNGTQIALNFFRLCDVLLRFIEKS
jgi:hypothetical protein